MKLQQSFMAFLFSEMHSFHKSLHAFEYFRGTSYLYHYLWLPMWYGICNSALFEYIILLFCITVIRMNITTYMHNMMMAKLMERNKTKITHMWRSISRVSEFIVQIHYSISRLICPSIPFSAVHLLSFSCNQKKIRIVVERKWISFNKLLFFIFFRFVSLAA